MDVSTMAEIQIAIAGPGAEQAAAALFAETGLEGSYALEDSATKDTTVAVIGTIVGITVGAMTIGEKLGQWYQTYKTKDESERIERVLIVTPTSRLLLEDVTPAEIAEAVKPLAK
jgi:hypothetical protein